MQEAQINDWTVWIFIGISAVIVAALVYFLRRAEREEGRYDASDDNDRGHW